MKKIMSEVFAFFLVVMMAFNIGTTAYAEPASSGSEEVLVNVGEEGYCETGSGWGTSGSLTSYDGTTKAYYNSTLGGSAEWCAKMPQAGNYEVYLWKVNSTYASALNLEYTSGEKQVVSMSAPEGGMMRIAAVTEQGQSTL